MRATLRSLPTPDELRIALTARLTRKQRSTLGQFMTPARTAEFMASLFEWRGESKFRLLDPGAGLGALTDAFLRRKDAEAIGGDVDVTAFEIDPILCANLREMLEHSSAQSFEICESDFVEKAPAWILDGSRRFTHVILNPPYKKIRSTSGHRSSLRDVGIETVNLYSAFVALCIELIESGGQLVAIIPRSFCNGTYYKPFRRMLLDLCAIRRIHLFGARDKAFGDDGILQENVIVVLERGGIQGPVTISTSTDDSLTDIAERIISFSEIVEADDRERFIRIPIAHDGQETIITDHSEMELLGHLGIEVSTGPVVDFRLRDYLRAEPTGDTVPLLYPGHFQRGVTIWPRAEFRKPNALALNDETWRWLYPKGFYTVVRRLTSKEEKRRVVANVVDPESFPGVELLGFENHLNVFHQRKRGLDAELAHGLAAYLNTDEVDQHFRSFNGHTQVNAGDLRSMRYPSVEALRELGREALRGLQRSDVVDALPESLTA